MCDSSVKHAYMNAPAGSGGTEMVTLRFQIGILRELFHRQLLTKAELDRALENLTANREGAP